MSDNTNERVRDSVIIAAYMMQKVEPFSLHSIKQELYKTYHIKGRIVREVLETLFEKGRVVSDGIDYRSSIYKNEEVTPKSKYSEVIYDADITSLPVGTIFIVVNGGWQGEIIEKDGIKFMRTVEGDLPIKKNPELNIKIKNKDKVIE